MSRTLWVAAAASLLLLSMGSLVLNTATNSVSINHESVYTTLCSIAPEYRIPAAPAVNEGTARHIAHPA